MEAYDHLDKTCMVVIKYCQNYVMKGEHLEADLQTRRMMVDSLKVLDI